MHHFIFGRNKEDALQIPIIYILLIAPSKLSFILESNKSAFIANLFTNIEIFSQDTTAKI